ncbi:MAG: hypothetical protein H6828_06020 [Planctomycetes bacterium]|nr:hypothetical protein [Planctomycetota bacterium]
MSNKKGDSSASADLLGFLLFGVGAVTSVVVAGALIFGLPEKEPDVMGRFAKAVIDFGGAAPSLLFGVAMMTLGARVFLNGPIASLAQHLSGVLGVSVGLAVLLGAFSPTLGGAVGDNTGGMVARNLTLVPGVLFGAATLALAVWMAWLRDSGLVGLSRNSYPALRDASEEQAVGVSAAEAEALLPDEVEEEEELAATALDATAASLEERPAWALHNEAPHPYPTDVRREGRIPVGARPLGEPEEGHAPDIDDAAEDDDLESHGTLHRWAPAHLADAGDAADEDLVAAASDADDLEDELGEPRPLDVQPTAAHGPADELDEPELSEAAPAAAAPRALGAQVGSPEVEAKLGLKIIRPSAIAPPRPSWEVDDEDEDVPVAAALAAEAETEDDAAAAAPAPAAVAADPDDAASLEALAALDDEEWEEVEEEEWEFVEVDEDDPEALAEGEEWEYVEVEVDEDEEEEEGVLEASAAEDEEDEEDELAAELEDDEEDEELEEELVDELAEDEDDEDAEEDEDELVAEDEAYEEDEELDEELAAELEEDEAPALVAVVDEEDLEPAPTAAAGERQMDLFAEPEELVAAAAEAETEAEAELEDEPVVVLQPQPALQASDLARRAAHMILAEDRVAVSMLQKAFSMDFKASCLVLDELQDLGLIGPYVDGRSRAILMSREEWLTAVGES